MEIQYRKMYGIEFTVWGMKEAHGMGKIERALVLAKLLKRLKNTWFIRRRMTPVILISDDYGSVTLEWEDDERRIYIEFELCTGCEYDAEGILEIVGFDGREYASLLRAFLNEIKASYRLETLVSRGVV